MTFYLKGLQKYERSKLKLLNSLDKDKTLTCRIFDTPLGTRHTVPHWKALRYGKDDLRGKSCGSTINIYRTS